MRDKVEVLRELTSKVGRQVTLEFNTNASGRAFYRRYTGVLLAADAEEVVIETPTGDEQQLPLGLLTGSPVPWRPVKDCAVLVG